ncbi:MAG TPA: hypothetical protein HA275_02240 [Halobacteriales archaeon]|uniref:hypothetical protein n=1 Tax=Candidatus Hikarchaeum yamanae TaxID=2675326 RepID=UPI0017FD9B5A|nr:hypothetical protein [Halobacteriales archaeon]|tara:strand:+ start:6831 stop:7193 length:363 start_codon:yes stop_codon:yes gene_type:complete
MDLSKTPSEMIYGGAIAIVSGIYSFLMGSSFTISPFTLPTILGVIVFIHGALLLFSPDSISKFSRESGLMMMVYSILMLTNQVIMQLTSMMMAEWDIGMVSLAILMLVSGRLMVSSAVSM